MQPADLLPSRAHVAAASLNQTVGDWSGNLDRIRTAVAAARERGAKLLLLPECCLSGYSLGDRLPRRGTLERSWAGLESLRADTKGMVVCVGLPIRHNSVLFDVMAVLADGELAGLAAKENLATGDVEYEDRWYEPWPRGRLETFTTPAGETCPLGSMVFEASGLGRFAIEICEDGWKGMRPGSRYALAGAEIVLNPSASWFSLGKHRVRRRIVEQASHEDNVAYLYASLLGCDSTRLVFDGSLFISSAGDVLREGSRFRFDTDYELVDCVVDLDGLRQVRMETGSWRRQAEALRSGELGPNPHRVRIPGHFSTDAQGEPPQPYWVGPEARHVDPSLRWLEKEGLVPRALGVEDVPHVELELALALGLRDYLAKSGIRRIALALSGGRDSAMVAVLVHRMLRYQHPGLAEAALAEKARETFSTAYMATAHSGTATREAARALAEELGARHHEAEIQEAVDTHVRIASEMTGEALSWDEPSHDLALQNVQARLRGSLIWMLANLQGALLLATSNKSEAAVGYTTMDGDTSGGLAPIADVPKSLVTLWLRWAADFHGYRSLSHVNALEPTAELRPPEREQTDEGDLMPFYVLDHLLEHFIQRGRDPVAMFDALWPSLGDRYGGDPRSFAADIRRFVTLFCRAQWKRERFAISLRVTSFDLDPKTGLRFPPVQAAFREELDELDRHVEALFAARNP